MTVSRSTLPANYHDWTAAQLLCQPEPQYLFADFFLSALGASLPIPAGMGLEGRQAPNAGAPYANLNRDRLKLATNLPKSLFAIGVDFAKTSGGTVKVNRPSFTDSTYTMTSRRLSTSQTISTSPITISSDQANLTLERFAGPYDNANSRIAPFAIESFDANMGVHSAASIVGANLARDFHKFLNSVHVTMGNVGTAVYPEGMTADNDATTVGSFPMTVEQLMRTEQLMDEQSLPTLPDGKRVLVLSPYQWTQLTRDPEYGDNSAFHPEFNILFANYHGTVCGFHVFKSTTLTQSTNGSSVPVHYAIAMAPGGFMGGVGRLPRVASSTDDNYGEVAKVIWLADLAFGIADSRFFRSLRSA